MAKKGKVQAEKDRKIKEENEKRKDFFIRLEQVVNKIGGEGTYSLIPKDHLELIFFMRTPAIRLVKSEELPFTDKVLKKLNKMLGELTRAYSFELESKDEEISIRDFITIWLTVHNYLNYEDVKNSDDLKELVIRLADCQSHEIRDRHITQVNIFLQIFAQRSGRPKHEFVWINSEYVYNNERCHLAWLFQLRTVKLIAKPIKCSDGTRFGYPVYYLQDQKPVQLQYELKKFGISPANNNDKVDLYVLDHALNRIPERLNCIDPGFLRGYILVSLVEPVITHESENRFLISLNIYNSKVGYFVAEYVDGVILVKTFLFLTNNGTPEGRRLNALTGLSKFDKKYLQIDQLKAFYDSDIESNEQLKSLFIEAGCASLFEIKLLHINKNDNVSKIASFIEKYLETGTFDDDFEDEDD